ncbi:unnamed protein product, partial [Meganyctiphanes norvegica]
CDRRNMTGRRLEALLLLPFVLLISSSMGMGESTSAMNSTLSNNKRVNPRLSCLPCEDTTCKKIKKWDCPWGITLDVCDCCKVCANEASASCGGLWNIGGTCGKGLECFGEDPTGATQGPGDEEGDDYWWGMGLCTPEKWCSCGLPWKKVKNTPKSAGVLP